MAHGTHPAMWLLSEPGQWGSPGATSEREPRWWPRITGMATIPILTLYHFDQRTFVAGIAPSGVRG
ncbi:MAG TPA: hypothetical protein VH813_00670 [Candidatus Limnocylindrales bacterium]